MIATGATRPPERDAEASTTLQIKMGQPLAPQALAIAHQQLAGLTAACPQRQTGFPGSVLPGSMSYGSS